MCWLNRLFGAPKEPPVELPPPVTFGRWLVEPRAFRFLGEDQVAYLMTCEASAGTFGFEAHPGGVLAAIFAIHGFESQGPRYRVDIRVGEHVSMSGEGTARRQGQRSLVVSGEVVQDFARDLDGLDADAPLMVEVHTLEGAEYRTGGRPLTSGLRLELPAEGFCDAWRDFRARSSHDT